MLFSRVILAIKNFFIYQFFSDNKSKITSQRLSNNDLMVLYNHKGIYCDMHIWDREYSLPQLGWLTGTYYNYFVKVLDGLKIPGWREDLDCDDFSKLFWSLCQACHRVSKTGIEGISVGMCIYTTKNGGGHAINTAVVENKEIVFIEPQTGEVLELTKGEIDSIRLVLF